jgi:hypothetical protein
MLMCEPVKSVRTSTPAVPSVGRQGAERGEVERMLREIAYVLHLTRRVKGSLEVARA